MTEMDPGAAPPAGEEDNDTPLTPPGAAPEEGAWRMAIDGYLAHATGAGTGTGGATPAPRPFRSRKGVPDRLDPERP